MTIQILIFVAIFLGEGMDRKEILKLLITVLEIFAAHISRQ
jgi:hypothetical protein